jgi:hypothetical protein
MATYHEMTQEGEAFGRFSDENEDKLSPAAHTLIEEAGEAAYREYLVDSVCYQPSEYETACEEMRVAAAQLTDLDLELLKQLVRRVLVAAASIDSFDEDTLVGYRVYRRDLYQYYDMAARMIRFALYREFARRASAEQEPIDESELPF